MRDKMILPFTRLLVQKHWQACTWLGQEATEWVLPCYGTWHPACQLWHHALLQVHRENISHPKSPVFSNEVVNLKEELSTAYTPLCSEIGSSFSFKVLLLALAETLDLLLCYLFQLPLASWILTHICLASLSCVFLHFYIVFFLIFLSLSFAIYVTKCICWLVSFFFNMLLRLALGLSLA